MRLLVGVILLSAVNFSNALDLSTNDQSRVCLAEVIYRESRGESFKGKLAVGQVVLNRVKHSLYPQSICDVVFQKYQFSWTITFKRFKATKEFYNIADIVIRGNHELRNFKATHFHGQSISPKWKYTLKRVAIIGNHIFYKL